MSIPISATLTRATVWRTAGMVISRSTVACRPEGRSQVQVRLHLADGVFVRIDLRQITDEGEPIQVQVEQCWSIWKQDHTISREPSRQRRVRCVEVQFPKDRSGSTGGFPEIGRARSSKARR